MPPARITLPLFLLLASVSLHAQDRPVQVVKGSVRDAGSQRPVVGATVLIEGTRMGAVTRADGSFTIESVPVGRHTLLFRSVGYESGSTAILVTSGRQTVVDFEMIESAIRMREVIVGAGGSHRTINETALVSTTPFTIDEVKRFAGGFEDPGRIAQNFAGVVVTSDKTNDIIIRGGSPSEVLWRLDGIDIPNPHHFASQGASGGPINAINSNLLSDSDVLTGAFPAEYGTRLSGVFDLRTRRGNRDRYEFVGQIGFNGIEGMAEGPIPVANGGSFIASYRKSTLEVFDMIGVSLGIGSIIPRYEDATVKVDLNLSSDDQLAITALGARSNASRPEPEIGEPYERSNHYIETSQLGAAGATWTRFLSDELLGQLSLSTQFNGSGVTGDSIGFGPDGRVAAITRNWLEDAGEGSMAARYRLSWGPTPEHRFVAAVEGRRLHYDLYEGDPRFPSETVSGNSGLDTTGSSAAGLGYVTWFWRPSETVTISSGVFSQYLGVSERLSVEPRLSLAWTLTPVSSLTVGLGVHRQAQPLAVYFRNPANEDLDFTTALHGVAGYTYRLDESTVLKGELYLKELSGIPVSADRADAFSMINAGPDFSPYDISRPLVNSGTGRSYGAELSLFREFDDGWYMAVTGSIVRQQYTGSDGILRNGVFDNGYVANLLGGYEWNVSPSFAIEFSGRFTVAGGRRSTPIDIERSRDEGRTVFDESRIYTERFDPYMRLDTKIDFRNNFEGWSLISYVSTLNTFNRDNVERYYYDPATGGIEHSSLLGLIPVGGIRVEF